MNIDTKLLKDARAASGAATDTDAVRMGLEALIRNAAYERLRSFRGILKGKLTDVPRRREKPVAKRSAA